MLCPICNLDLSPLDLYSKQEHCELCLENGPSIVTTNDAGQLTIIKNVGPGKQRKICPICDKTFQNLSGHFKTCAIKNDVPPQLMLEYWDKINSDSKKPKKFPREMLDTFVRKCVKEGRIGDQVDFARALSLSMADSEPQTSSINMINEDTTQTEDSNLEFIGSASTASATLTDVSQVLMSSAAQQVGDPIVSNKPVDKKKRYKLELVEDRIKRSNIMLRMDRELAATRSRRHEEALAASRFRSSSQQSGYHDDDDYIIEIIDDTKSCDTGDLDKLFFKARLKDCTDSIECQQATCQGHELSLIMEWFQVYAGTSMDADPGRKRGAIQEVTVDDIRETADEAIVIDSDVKATCNDADEEKPLA